MLIVDDHAVVRDGLKRIVEEYSRGAVFGDAETPDEAVQRVRAQDWDLVVLDISLGGKSGLDLLKDIKRIRPSLPVLMLTMHPEEKFARRAFKSGAAGYIMKNSPRAALVGAISKVSRGGKYISAAFAETLLGELDEDVRLPLHETLSDREFEVMRLIGSGKTVGEVARLLSLSQKTISTHRAHILEKMGLKSNTEIVRYVIEHRLTI